MIGGRLIDGTGKEPLENSIIVIEGRLITRVGTVDRIQPPAAAKTVDLAGHTIMPGLMDLHVHLCAGEGEVLLSLSLLDKPMTLIGVKGFARARKALEMGFTTLRDAGDIGHLAVSLREAINSGVVEGPRIIAGGRYLSATGGQGDLLPPWLQRTDAAGNVADGADEIRKYVRQQIKMNNDWIKFAATGTGLRAAWDEQQFSDEEMKVIVGESHAKGRKVFAHCGYFKGTLAAVRAGVDSVEHGCERTEELCDLMVEKGTFLVPTLIAVNSLVQGGERLGFSAQIQENYRHMLESQVRSFKTALEAGVKIALGTDAGLPTVPHGASASELELLVRYGLRPMQAIMAATSQAASCLKMEDKLGTVEEGKLADLVVVQGDPLEDIKVLQVRENIKMVLKEGAVYVNRL
ncbi:MAG: amidohydrolase family protein [Pseudomonadota bacterium]